MGAAIANTPTMHHTCCEEMVPVEIEPNDEKDWFPFACNVGCGISEAPGTGHRAPGTGSLCRRLYVLHTSADLEVLF